MEKPSTNWFALIGASVSVTGLLIVIGALILTPMQSELNKLRISFDQHEHLHLHPVGQSRIDTLEKRYDDIIAQGVERIKLLDAKTELGLKELDARLQREFLAANTSIKETATQLEKNFGDKHDTLRKEFELIRNEGSPRTRERLGILETQMNNKQKENH